MGAGDFESSIEDSKPLGERLLEKGVLLSISMRSLTT